MKRISDLKLKKPKIILISSEYLFVAQELYLITKLFYIKISKE